MQVLTIPLIDRSVISCARSNSRLISNQPLMRFFQAKIGKACFDDTLRATVFEPRLRNRAVMDADVIRRRYAPMSSRIPATLVRILRLDFRAMRLAVFPPTFVLEIVSSIPSGHENASWHHEVSTWLQSPYRFRSPCNRTPSIQRLQHSRDRHFAGLSRNRTADRVRAAMRRNK